MVTLIPALIWTGRTEMIRLLQAIVVFIMLYCIFGIVVGIMTGSISTVIIDSILLVFNIWNIRRAF